MFFSLDNITHRFAGSRNILNGVSANLELGRIYALMGENGAGKTTLFNIISGFVKPLSGNVYMKGEKITGLPPYKINRLGIGRTFQDLRLISKLSVEENVILAMKGHPSQNWYKALLPEVFYKKEILIFKRKAEEILRTCFIEEIRYRLAGEISYGQQKLLNLACCLASDAKIFLLDEPVASINFQYRERIAGLMKELITLPKTILLIEHNADFIAETADHILYLTDGKIITYNNFVELKSSGKVADVGI